MTRIVQSFVIDCQTGGTRIVDADVGPPGPCQCVVKAIVDTSKPCTMESGPVPGPGGGAAPTDEECRKLATENFCWIVCPGKSALEGINNTHKTIPSPKQDDGIGPNIYERHVWKDCNCTAEQCGGREKCARCESTANRIYRDLRRQVRFPWWLLFLPVADDRADWHDALKRAKCRLYLIVMPCQGCGQGGGN